MVNVVRVFKAGKGYTTVLADDGNTYRLEGARNWRNNNPGNIEYGPYAKSLGAVGSDGRFAVFPTLEQGTAAQENLQFNSKGYKGLTVGQAINRYAPPFENNTNAYANAVARAAGVSTDTPMSSLTPEQRAAFMAAQREVEGFRAGKQIPVGMTTPVPFAQLAGGAPMAMPSNNNAAPVPPLPIPRPQTPGMKPLPSPAPLTAASMVRGANTGQTFKVGDVIPSSNGGSVTVYDAGNGVAGFKPVRSPWDIPGILNVQKEMTAPTIVGSYIRNAMANAPKPDLAPVAQNVQATAGNVQKAANIAIDQGKSTLANAGNAAVSLLGGLFGRQPNPPPRPPADIPPKPLQTVGMEPPPITMGIPQPARPPVTYTMNDLMGTSMARLPLPPGQIAPVLHPAPLPVMPRQIGTPPGTPLHMTVNPPPVPTRRPITYNFAPVTAAGQRTDVFGNDMAFMPTSVQKSSRWNTGY